MRGDILVVYIRQYAHTSVKKWHIVTTSLIFPPKDVIIVLILFKSAVNYLQEKEGYRGMLAEFIQSMRDKLGFARPPELRSVDDVISYVDKQAAYVSQVTLYGYVKTRAGTQWPKLFNNETYLISLRVARWHIFGACVADLALFISARMVRYGQISPEQAEMLSCRVTDAILRDYDQNDIEAEKFAEMAQRARARATSISWFEAAEEPISFEGGADAFMRWAPMADEFKTQDEEIMRNSIHMRWIGIRREVKEYLCVEEIRQDMLKS